MAANPQSLPTDGAHGLFQWGLPHQLPDGSCRAPLSGSILRVRCVRVSLGQRAIPVRSWFRSCVPVLGLAHLTMVRQQLAANRPTLRPPSSGTTERRLTWSCLGHSSTATFDFGQELLKIDGPLLYDGQPEVPASAKVFTHDLQCGRRLGSEGGASSALQLTWLSNTLMAGYARLGRLTTSVCVHNCTALPPLATCPGSRTVSLLWAPCDRREFGAKLPQVLEILARLATYSM